VSQLQSQSTKKLTCRGRHIFTPPGWSIIYAEVRWLEQYNNTGGLEKSPGANVPAIRRLAEQRIALGRNQEGSLQRPGRSANFSRFDKSFSPIARYMRPLVRKDQSNYLEKFRK
jgi:hypothetical protein